MSVEFIAFSNIFLVPIVGLFMIMIDYYGRCPSDSMQRKLFTLLICFTLAVMSCDLIHAAVTGKPGVNLRIIHWAANTFYFFFQVISFSILFLFLVHTANGDLAKLKNITASIGILNILNIAALVVNLFTGQLFYVADDNSYVRGQLYVIVIAFPYMLILFMIFIAIIYRKYVNRTLLVLALVSVLPTVIGSMSDIVFAESRIKWPGFFVSLLFCYLFIIRMTMLVDCLTNVFNRRGCDEYLISIAKPALRRKDYSFIMIDLDRFKQINDQFGHSQGDCALRDAAYIMRSSVRRGDFVARYGGDEFMIVAATKNVGTMIENLLCKTQEFNVKQSRPYTLALSCGGDVYRQDDPRTPLEFLTHVDTLMYAEKERRRTSPRIDPPVSAKSNKGFAASGSWKLAGDVASAAI